MHIQYSIIVPVYGSENALEKLHEAILSFFEGRFSFEIIYVDDHSSDKSWEVLKKIRSSCNNCTIVRLSKNFGQHAATLCGFKYAKGDFLITMDDDLEVHPNEAENLISVQARGNHDVVYGEYEKLNKPALRSFFTALYKVLSKMEDGEKGKGSSFRLIKKEYAHKLVQNHKHFVFVDELLLWYTRNMAFIPVNANPHFVEKKRYNMGSLFSLAGNVILFSSTFPLKLVTRVGFLLFSVNFVIGIYFLLKKFFFKIDVEGYTSLIISILFSTGLIIFCIGVLAQYISRAVQTMNNVPAYNEEEVVC